MKQFAEFIKAQIHKLELPELRDWLLSHIKDDSINLKDLFCKQYPASAQHIKAFSPGLVSLPTPLAFCSIIFAYAPDKLVIELIDKLNTLSLADKMEVPPDINFSEQIYRKLGDYRDAWPLIMSLKNQGANDLIHILDSADKTALKALTNLTSDNDLITLIETFLVKNNKELESVNRNRLIQFLRHPDLNGKLTRLIDLLINQSIDFLSSRLLLLIYSPKTKALEKLTELRSCLAENPFPVHLEVFTALCHMYYEEIQNDHTSPQRHSFVLLLNDLLNQNNLEVQIQFLNGLNASELLLIADLCLQESSSGDSDFQQICRNLLFLVCSESIISNKETLSLIRKRLEQQDFYLFGTVELMELAKEINPERKDETDKDGAKQVTPGIWIQKLLTSPRFIAQCSPVNVHRLTERFGLLGLTLSQDAYNRYSSDNKIQGFYLENIQECLRNVALNIQHHPESKPAYLVKRNILLRFRAENTINALLLQAEEACTILKEPDRSIADQALNALYLHYRNIHSNLRMDLFVQLINHTYGILSSTEGYKTGKAIERKKEIWVYNSAGQKIGFINDSNEVMAFVDDEPVLLGQTGSVQDNEPLYDEENRIAGYLTESSQFKSPDYPGTVSAYILARLPEKELEKSGFGLKLLIQNVLFENSVDALYRTDEVQNNSLRQRWLERHFSNELQVTEQKITPLTLGILINNFSDEGVFLLLANIQHQSNALSLFHSIVTKDKLREILFSGLYESDFQRFLEHHDAAYCLAEYMVQNHDKTWFAEGLSRFAFYGKKYKKENLLSSALAIIVSKAGKDENQKASCDAVLESLVNTEACASLVLNEFLNDKNQQALQKLKNPEINKIAQYFSKKHLIVTIKKLNKTSYWEESAQYKLILHLLKSCHDQLFPVKEFFSSAKEGWQINELNSLVAFIGRHLSKKRPLDINYNIGYRILGDLIFRCAKMGQVSLFYRGKAFNPAITRLSFTRSFLVRIIDKLWIPQGVRELLTQSESAKVLGYVDQSIVQKELKDHLIFQDWCHLINQTWTENSKRKLPVLTVFLLNYAGTKQPLLRLLNDYFTHYQKSPDYIIPVSRLLLQFPQRDVSAVIFDGLEAAIIQNPDMLDSTLLRTMGQFYAKRILKQDIKTPQAELSLLTYFGQNKQYSLVERGCSVLSGICKDKELRQRLAKAANEAAVEKDLSGSMGRFYFGILKIIKRLWNYGFNAEQKSSRIIKFCDDNTPGLTRQIAADHVKLPVAGPTSSSYLDFKEKHRQLINLLATIKRSPVHNSMSGSYAATKRSIFGVNTEQEQQNSVASKQPVISI